MVGRDLPILARPMPFFTHHPITGELQREKPREPRRSARSQLKPFAPLNPALPRAAGLEFAIGAARRDHRPIAFAQARAVTAVEPLLLADRDEQLSRAP